MDRWLTIRDAARPGVALLRARWCTSFLCRLRGLTFRRAIEPGTGLLLVQPAESRSGAAIHMWAVFFPLGVVWLDSARRVVDTRLARPWGMYAPRQAARYILEGHPGLLDHVTTGDVLEFDEDAGR